MTWNRPKFLELCLEDLCKKMYYRNDCEIIVMDDASNNETAKMLDSYEKKQGIKIIRNKKHRSLQAYKKLFGKAKGEYIVDVDDDVLQFPFHFDKTMIEYLNEYSDYGYLALDVIQNEHTNGAKPDASYYTEDVRNDKVVQRGVTGGWCTCFRRKDYLKIKWRFNFTRINFKFSEDAALSNLFNRRLKLKSGIIKDHFCFHASGPYYAKQYGNLEREIEKYRSNDLGDFVDLYKSYLDN